MNTWIFREEKIENIIDRWASDPRHELTSARAERERADLVRDFLYSRVVRNAFCVLSEAEVGGAH